MIFYILANQITTLFLSMSLLTTLSFDSSIESYIYGGSKEDIYFKVTGNSKTLVIKPKMAPIKDKSFSNLLVVTKKAKYYFNLNLDERNPHQFLEIKEAQINKAMKEVVSTKDYKILEGTSSSLIINQGQNELRVNSMNVIRKQYLGKGIPIIIESNRILN